MSQYAKYPANVLTTSPLEFTRNGLPQAVIEDTGTPANNRPLPVKLDGPNGPVTTTVSGPNVSLDVNVVSGASSNVNIHDGAGNSLTSQVNGAARALDVGIDVAGVQVDPRAIRALVPATDEVKARMEDGAGTALTSTLVAGKQSLDVNVTAGGSSNASVSATGAAVPASATYSGMNVAGNLTGLTGTVNGLKVDGSAVTQPVSGTVTANQGGAPWSQNITQVGGSAVTLGQKTSANSIPTVLASDQSAIPVTQSGTWTVQPGNTANTTPWLATINQGGNSATVSAGGALKVDGSAATQPVSGTVTANQGTSPWVNNITQIGGSALALGQTTMANSVPVVLASNQSSVNFSQAGRSKVNLIRNDYSSVNVTTAAYVQLLASTAATINRLDVFDSSGQTLVFAVGAAAAEVDQFYIYPGGNGAVELSIPSGSRLSVKAVSATASVGELDINTFG